VRERDYDDMEGVDGKLVRLAKELGAEIITTDFNLNKVAQIQGVEVLNLNDLANALKPAVLPGESLSVKIIREGREYEQGVGYLADGTMIVVEGGKGLVGQEVDVEVTSVLQSSSGKMIFTKVPRAEALPAPAGGEVENRA
jgi:Integral membrane protein (PIN domain superfamily)